jgi:hypothetical protein
VYWSTFQTPRFSSVSKPCPVPRTRRDSGASAKGTPYVVAGVYDDKATIAELSKLSSKK